MRFRIPGRIFTLGVLLALLCLLPASTHVAFARPIGWDNPDMYPDPPSGDNDGVVVKGPSASASLRGVITGTTSSRWVVVRTDLRLFYALVRLDPLRLLGR